MLSNESEKPAHKRHQAFLASIEPKHRISDTLLRYTIPSRLLQVEHSFATAYSKEKIGLVERANQEVVRHLRAMLFDDKWSYEQLPMVQRIMNTVEKTSTGVSPAELILNNSIRLSNQILAPGSVNPTSRVALSGTMDNWVARQYTLLQVAQAHQHQSDSHLLVEYDSYVLFTPPVGRGNRLLPKHRGPFQVIDTTDSIYIIEDLVSGQRITTHIHNLRPFIYDPIRNRRSTLQFNVRWSGIDDSSDSWEPYKALMHVDKLHDYLRANAMKTLIPREHK